MADTGYNWGAWAFAKDDGGTDWDEDLLVGGITETSNTSISLDGKAACEVGIALKEDGALPVTDDTTIYVLGSGGGLADEETTIGNPWCVTITAVTSDVVYMRFAVDPRQYGDFKIAVKNGSSNSIKVSVKYRTATIPVAS